MKKTFFYMLACILPALALTSCSSDDDDSTPQYDFGLEVNDEAPDPLSNAYSMAKNTISNFQKNYVGKKKFATDKEAEDKFQEGADLLNTSVKEFEEYLRTHDAGACKFKIDCTYTVKGGKLNLTKSANFDYNYARAPRTEADKKVIVDVKDFLEKFDNVGGNEVVSFNELGFEKIDTKGVTCSLGKDILVVNPKTYELVNENPFSSITIVDNEEGNGHNLVLGYSFDKATCEKWLGDWYFLIPITISDISGSMTRDIKLNVTIK